MKGKKRQIRNLLSCLFIAAFSLSGCGTLSREVPVRPAPEREFPAPPMAVIRVPVVVSLPLGDLAGGQGSADLSWDIPKDLSNLVQFTKGAAVEAWRDPLHLKASQDSFSTLMNIHYRVGEDVLGLSLKGASQAKDLLGHLPGSQETVAEIQTVLQWNKAWHLDAVPSLPPLKGVNQSVTAFSEKVNDLLKQEGENLLLKENQRFDERLNAVSDLEPRAREIWAQLQEPIYLDKGIWFLLQPQNMGVAPIHLNPLEPQTLDTTFELTAYPVILFGEKPNKPSVPLPPLSPYQEGPGGFRALSNLMVGYPEAGRLIRDLHMGVVGHVFKETGDRKLEITGLRLYGSGGKVVAEVQLQYEPILNLSDKPAQMTVYLVGTLRYRPQKREFDLPDIDYDVKTSDFLVQVADWIFKSDIRDLLRQKARIPVGPKLDELKEKLSKALNRSLGDHLSLATQVESFKVLDAFADNEGMKARVSLEGSAVLNVDWK